MILAFVEPLFESGPIWIVVSDVPGSDDTIELLELESAEMEAELGGSVIVGRDPPTGANALILPSISNSRWRRWLARALVWSLGAPRSPSASKR